MSISEDRPSWMTTGSLGIRSLTEKDTAESGPAQQQTRSPFEPDSKVFGDRITQDMAIELGNKAVQSVPWRLISKPFGVQAYALHRARTPGTGATAKRGFGFFLEQGLGKTKTTIADFWNCFEAGLVDCLVVVTVNSMKATWRYEMEQENFPFDIHVWPKYSALPSRTRGQVVIINYEALFRAGGKMLFEWMRRGKPYLAFDEATGLMNHTSQQSKAGVNLASVASMQRCLAGKPNPMGPHNLWPQLKVIGVPVGNFYGFRNTFCVMGGFKGKEVTGAKNVDSLAAMMRPACFFADKRTWAPTLPDKRYAQIVCEMSEEQEKAYKTMANELYAEIEDGLVTIESSLHRSLKLQQIASGFIYTEDRQVKKIGKQEPSKLAAVRDFIAASSGKTIIFAHFLPTIELLLKMFPGAPHALSRSRMSEEELEEHKARFNSDSCDLPFIASSSVLKFGHTLIGTATNPCENVLFVENTYSLLTREQAEDRSHRWGATADTVTYWDMVCSEIDRKMVKALKDRSNMSMALLDALKGLAE